VLVFLVLVLVLSDLAECSSVLPKGPCGCEMVHQNSPCM
jgi:hypothetical protein